MERITRYTLMSYRPDEIFNAYELGFSTDINETTFGPCARKTLIIHYVFVGSGYFNGIKIHFTSTLPQRFLNITSNNTS